MTTKKQRVTPTSSKFLQLPADTIICILDFCTDSDLHCTVPFICKQIRIILKNPLLKPERIEEESQKIQTKNEEEAAERKQKSNEGDEENLDHTVMKHQKRNKKQTSTKRKKQSRRQQQEEEEDKADDSASSSSQSNVNLKDEIKKVSVKEYITEFTALEENLLWKRKCIKTMPSLSTIKQDHLYCYRKLYLQHYSIKKPPVYRSYEVVKLQQYMSRLQTLVMTPLIEDTRKDPVLCRESNSKEKPITEEAATQSHEKYLWNRFDLLKEKVSEMVTRIQEAQMKQGHAGALEKRKKVRLPPPLFREYEDLITFLRETTVITSKRSNSPDPIPFRYTGATFTYEHDAKLLSPVNGRSVSIKHTFTTSGDLDNYRLEEIHESDEKISLFYYDITGSLLFEKEIDVDNIDCGLHELWHAVQFLGLSSYLPANASVASKLQLVHRIYYEIIHYSMHQEVGHEREFKHRLENSMVQFPKMESTYEGQQATKSNRRNLTVVSYEQYMAEYTSQVHLSQLEL